MRTARSCILVLASCAAACTASDTQTGSDQQGLARRGGAGSGSGAPVVVLDAGQTVLECPRGGAVGAIHVEFACDGITVYSCKDLSNVVVEFEDGTRQRFEGLTGQQATFGGTGANAGARIVGVWVKAGNNQSGDGPGYGERFDAPDGPCVPNDGGMAGSGGSGGTGDDDPCLDNDPDTFCGEGEPGEPGGSGGSGGNDGEWSCEDNPDDPACHVE